MSSDITKTLTADSWNACIKLICPIRDMLNGIQRKAALVFEYYGRVMNGGHSFHFDVYGDSPQPELVQALNDLGAARHARILKECYFLRREAKLHQSEEEQDYVAETIQDLDREFYRLEPDILEFLARYFKSHPESFPV